MKSHVPEYIFVILLYFFCNFAHFFDFSMNSNLIRPDWVDIWRCCIRNGRWKIHIFRIGRMVWRRAHCHHPGWSPNSVYTHNRTVSAIHWPLINYCCPFRYINILLFSPLKCLSTYIFVYALWFSLFETLMIPPIFTQIDERKPNIRCPTTFIHRMPALDCSSLSCHANFVRLVEGATMANTWHTGCRYIVSSISRIKSQKEHLQFRWKSKHRIHQSDWRAIHWPRSYLPPHILFFYIVFFPYSSEMNRNCCQRDQAIHSPVVSVVFPQPGVRWQH